MGLFKKAKPEETGEKKDLKANYTTEDHKTDLDALLASFGTNATKVGPLPATGPSRCEDAAGGVAQRLQQLPSAAVLSVWQCAVDEKKHD